MGALKVAECGAWVVVQSVGRGWRVGRVGAWCSRVWGVE